MSTTISPPLVCLATTKYILHITIALFHFIAFSWGFIDGVYLVYGSNYFGQIIIGIYTFLWDRVVGILIPFPYLCHLRAILRAISRKVSAFF